MRFQWLTFAAAAFLLTVPPVNSQISGGLKIVCDNVVCRMTFTLAPNDTSVAGSAYSGTQTIQSTANEGNGIGIPDHDPPPITIYRDSKGRLRTERPGFSGPNSPIDFTDVRILDAVAGYVYVLDSVDRVAHRMAVKVDTRPGPPLPCVENDSCVPLGTKVISGVNVVGRRTTSPFRGTTREGTSVTGTSMIESWTDPRNNVEVMRKITRDSGATATIFSIRDYSNAEPDAALFQVPPDYRVVDEPTYAFTIVQPRTR